MASVIERNGVYCAQIRRKGHKPIHRSFDAKKEAESWARRIEAEMELGIYHDKTEAERTTLREALERYRLEVSPTKHNPRHESGQIDRWLRYDICYKSLASLKGADFSKYRDNRRKAGRAENTIRLELQLVSHMFEIARKEWGMEYLTNPLNNIRKPQGSNARSRRLEDGEYELIHQALTAHTNPYAVAAFDLAIETSLRQSVLFQLRWEWVDLKARMIRFPVSITNTANKGVPSVLPLSSHAISVLQSLCGRSDDKPSGLVLKTSANAIACIWKRLLPKLGVNNLRWHDLRHEAASRLFEKGFHPLEVASITGHKSMQMLKRYTHLKPERLLEKLG